MAMRNLLHQSKLHAFRVWLENDGWTICNEKGFYEVLRAKKNGRLVIVYRKIDSEEHFSVRDADCSVVRKFISQTRREKDESLSKSL